jgi:hypothetical protein
MDLGEAMDIGREPEEIERCDLERAARVLAAVIEEGDIEADGTELDELVAERDTLQAQRDGLFRLAVAALIEVERLRDEATAAEAGHDYLGREYDRLRIQVTALTGEHSGTCDDMAQCQRCADRDEVEHLQGIERRAREVADGPSSVSSHTYPSNAARYILGGPDGP